MKILVILAHPDESSFNHAVAKTAIQVLENNGHEVISHDLYKEHFDAILPKSEILKKAKVSHDIKEYCRELADADGIIIVHPNWWGQPPAILKGYIDRVFRPGVAYEFAEGDSGEGVPVGLLRARIALVFNTSNTRLEREMEVFGDPLQSLWKQGIFDLCGVKRFHRRMFSVVVTSTTLQRQVWLEEVQKIVGSYFPGVISRAQAV
ncbi:MAG: NAD(P)H-dependent oxidoreductase [Chloroflexi bacterium]|nr:NAD(P)H-dependent oxidoreductase [Chloroflexota bacterium]